MSFSGGGCPFGHGQDPLAAGASPQEQPKLPYERAVRSGPQRPPPVRPRRPSKPLYYHNYLGLDKILSAQSPRSAEVAGPENAAHDEMLFIIIHQTYELWFKQVLHELDDACALLNAPELSEKDLSVVVSRLRRCAEIFKVLVSQLGILETMTPLSFLDFREYLYPASGFQSLQWRLVEIKLGLRREQRMHYAKTTYDSHLSETHAGAAREAEGERSLFDLVDSWLSRTPFLQTQTYDFWTEYQRCVVNLHEVQREEINADANMPPEVRAKRLEEIQGSQDSFTEFFNQEKYQEQLDSGRRRLSYSATKAAIMIQLYQEEPVFQLPFQLLTCLLDIDELLTSWRHRHSMMVHRMLGMKVGTGSSSGYNYLRMTATKHKVFTDFFDLSMFLVPRSDLPELPRELVNLIRFHYTLTPEQQLQQADAAVAAAAAAAPQPSPQEAEEHKAQE